MKDVFPLLVESHSFSPFPFTIPTQKPKTNKKIPHFPGLETIQEKKMAGTVVFFARNDCLLQMGFKQKEKKKRKK